MTRRDVLRTGVAAPAAISLPAAAPAGGAPGAGPQPRERLLLDFGWRFRLGHAGDPALDFGLGAGAQTFAKSGGFVPPGSLRYDDSAWQAVDLPHDWAVDLPFENDRSLVSHGCKPLGRRYPATSVGWYRRVFEVPGSDAGRRISLEFDGVFRDAIVVFNGHYLGENLSGYAPFRFDVTDFVNYGSRNVLVLRVDASLGEGWFYEGAGIYRHVWLVKTNPLHVMHGGVAVRTAVKSGAAVLSIATEVENEDDAGKACRVVSTIVDPAGTTVATVRSPQAAIPGWGKHVFVQQVAVTRPALWSVASPNLYRLQTAIETGGTQVDRCETTFGIRTVRFDPDQGLLINGEPVRVKGTCNHQDHAGVGAALPDRIQYYRIERLKEMGSNAYRCSHNPPTPELLDACDRLGMIVMDETRMMSSSPEGLSQLERLVRRDRNHPSVVLWSLGNEEPEQGTERGMRIVATMKRVVRRLDPTRPVTVAMNNGWNGNLFSVVDVVGFNYNEKQIDGIRKRYPGKPMIGAETASTVSTRGVYENDKQKGYVSAYDLNYPPWASTAERWWKFYQERPWLAGGFAWTGFDYRGEPTPYGWPCINSHFGIMDVCGFPKDNFYYYKAWWTDEPVLHLFPHWNWEGREGQEIDVWCHTNLERVELFLNGRSLGSQVVSKDTHVAWKVKYEPGSLEARGFRGGRQMLTARRETAGAPARLVLRPDRARISADGEDVSMVAVEVVDAEGRTAPLAGNEIAFQVTGSGRLLGVGNGDPSSHEADKASRRRAFNGLCMAIVQASKQAGQIQVDATSPGLTGASIRIVCEPATPRPSAG